jgi:hypothetical protein
MTDRQRQRWLAAVAAETEADRAQDEHEEREEERTAMIREHWQQSQSQLSSLDLSSSNPPSEDESSSSKADNTKALDHDIFNEGGEPRCSGRVRRSFADVAGRSAGKGEREDEAGGEEREGEGNEHATADRRVQSGVSIAFYIIIEHTTYNTVLQTAHKLRAVETTTVGQGNTDFEKLPVSVM